MKEKKVKSRTKDSLKTVKAPSKFRCRETGEKWYGPTMFIKVDVACYIVNYIGHVLFQCVYRINQSYLAFSSTGYMLSPLLLLRSQQSRGYTQSTRKFDNSDLFC